MALQSAVLVGTVTPDGRLELDDRLYLAPGRVQVVVEPLRPSSTEDEFLQLMQMIWAIPVDPGSLRTAEEIEAERERTRDEWEERSIELERLQGLHRPVDPPAE
jgi:hypothetical protein